MEKDLRELPAFNSWGTIMKNLSLKKLLPMAALVMAAAVPMAAQATCVASGEVVRFVALPGAGATAMYVQAVNSLNPLWFVYTTSDIAMKAQLPAVGTRVTAVGSAASCPTAGTLRAAGVLLQLVINP